MSILIVKQSAVAGVRVSVEEAVDEDALREDRPWLETQKVTPRGGTFFALCLMHTLFVVKYLKYPVSTWG